MTTVFGASSVPEAHAAFATARAHAVAHATQVQVQAFFNLIAPMAQAEQAQYGIPASLAMAVAADETGYGQNVFSQQNNDFFNVTCGANGADYTESPRATGVVYNGSYCYLTYANPGDGFLDWGYFLVHDPHYSNLTQLTSGTPDLDAAIAALYQDGYAGAENISIVQAIHDGNMLSSYNIANVPAGTCTLATCVIDEKDPGFTWTGPITSPARIDNARGYLGHSYWTSNCGAGSQSDCSGGKTSDVSGSWSANLPQAMQYEVDVAIPVAHATTQNAIYTIQSAGGQVITTTLNQDAYPPAGSHLPFSWVSLGVYSFDAGTANRVTLADLTNEPYATKAIAWGALRFVAQVSGTPTPTGYVAVPFTPTVVSTPVTGTATLTSTGNLSGTAIVSGTATATPTVVPVQTPSAPPKVGPIKLAVALSLPHSNACTFAPIGVHIRSKPKQYGYVTLLLVRKTWLPVMRHHKVVRYAPHTTILVRKKAKIATGKYGTALYVTGLPCLYSRPTVATLRVATSFGKEYLQMGVPLLVFKRVVKQSKHTSHRRS